MFTFDSQINAGFSRIIYGKIGCFFAFISDAVAQFDTLISHKSLIILRFVANRRIIIVVHTRTFNNVHFGFGKF